ncbi:MAG: FecR family protein [Elusimicrobiota bacterium]|jgi:hypothetical protein
MENLILKTALFSSILLFPAAWASAALPGVTLLPHGIVEVRAGVRDQWRQVSSRTEMVPGYDIRTTKTSTAELEFSDGSRILLSPGALFTVEQTDSREARFRLDSGKLKAYVAGLFSSRLKIRTPTAVASVRGTEFEMSAEPQGDTSLSVAEGHLEVSDSAGRTAVITSEETLNVGKNGLEQPRTVALTDDRARDAARPIAVAMETARDRTRAMLEDLRGRELKANEAQLGKDVIDAFGKRVRLEEYLLRPAANEFKLVFLSKREDRLDWGHLIERFNSKIPDDLTQVAGIVAQTYFSRTMPSNWLKYFEVYLTNTKDSIRETVTLGAPTAINFTGYGAAVGTRYYPSSIDYVQTLGGPGVPGGSKVIFQQQQDFNSSFAGQVTFTQKLLDASGNLTTYAHFRFDPSNTAAVADIQTGGCGSSCYPDDAVGGGFDPTTTDSFPNGPNRADFLRSTRYADGTVVSVEKILVGNDGKILDFANPNADTFNQAGSYNLEIVAKSSLFQGRKIDVLIAPEILAQKKMGTTDPANLQPR